MPETGYFKCSSCGYEFLSRSNAPSCPRCNKQKMEKLDLGKLAAFDG